MSRQTAAIWAALEALAAGEPEHAEAILLNAVEEEGELGTANPRLRPAGGWPGERWSL
jgi:hypothetical protein